MKIDIKLIIGTFFIMLGLLFFAQQTFEFDINIFEILMNFWPLIFVYFGLKQLSENSFKIKEKFFSPIFLIILGVLLIANNFQMLPWGFWETLWPISFITIGLNLIFNKTNKKKNFKQNSYQNNYQNNKFTNNYNNSQSDQNTNYETNHESENFFGNTTNNENYNNYLELNGFFSGTYQKLTSKNLKGGEVNVIFAGAEIDFRDADLDDDNMPFEISAIFGGVEIYVPYHWKVEVIGTPVFGGLSNNTRFDDSYISLENKKEKILKIHYTVIFGGIEIKN